jgi:CDP-paratose 2-epimerase
MLCIRATWLAWWIYNCAGADLVSFYVSGGQTNSMSLAQLTAWCDQRFGRHQPLSDGSERPYDVPWLILDSSKAFSVTDWKPQISLLQVLEEIADHASTHPDWLTWCGA